jgi:DeoR/GlpR family transcriptional regulator of sugar metabolism
VSAGLGPWVLAPQRRRLIADVVRAEGAASTERLCRDLGVSYATVRRDLARLAHEGVVERVHGGVVRAAWLDGPPKPAR